MYLTLGHIKEFECIKSSRIDLQTNLAEMDAHLHCVKLNLKRKGKAKGPETEDVDSEPEDTTALDTFGWVSEVPENQTVSSCSSVSCTPLMAL